mmetsp:Transcript_5145/g.8004  ORF Transcript_5145/g.8004 Transcript_5145/m.8004 type:complete len:250 (-) Transcript_5145:135-884(-)
MLTVLPTFLPSKTVCRMVSGMSHTLNRPALVSPTVSEHPSTATKPFGKMYLLHLESNSNITMRLFSVSTCSTILAWTCTCPDTVCPPISSPTRAERSKFTLEPGSNSPRLVARRVSTIRSKLAVSPAVSTTVRHVPLHDTLAPMRMPLRVPGGNVSFRRAKSPTLSNDTTSAVPCTRPVKSAVGPTTDRLLHGFAATTRRSSTVPLHARLNPPAGTTAMAAHKLMTTTTTNATQTKCGPRNIGAGGRGA